MENKVGDIKCWVVSDMGNASKNTSVFAYMCLHFYWKSIIYKYKNKWICKKMKIN